MKKFLAILLAMVMVCSLSAVAFADYPDKGITAINPWGAGGGTDNCLRAFCAALEKQLGVTITVDNLTGASGVIGHEAIADAEPDGPDKDFLDSLTPESLKVIEGCKVEAYLASIPMPEKNKTSTSYQFMRQGYFCLDNTDSRPDHLVFNRAVALKESFKK